MTTIAVIPDTQVKDGVDTEHLRWAGEYLAEKKPDYIVHVGDHWDMPSLSSYDVGKKSFEGRRYFKDIESGNKAMAVLMKPINAELAKNARKKRNKKKTWNPELHFLLGNHEQRIERAIDKDAILEDTIGYHDFDLEGWEVHDFLDVLNIEGVMFSHYFTSGVMGRPVASARALLAKKHMSCIMGHVQNRDIAYDIRADGKRLTSIFAGIFYQHDEGYLGAQGNSSWRGIWMLHEVTDGTFDEMPVSLDYLRSKYE